MPAYAARGVDVSSKLCVYSPLLESVRDTARRRIPALESTSEVR